MDLDEAQNRRTAEVSVAVAVKTSCVQPASGKFVPLNNACPSKDIVTALGVPARMLIQKLI